MTDDAGARRRLIMDAFDAALDQASDLRTAWLHTTYSEQPDVILAVKALIEADAASSIIIDRLAPDSISDFKPPERVGVYRLVRSIGGGGMGEVWLGERDDGLFEHRVAIKLMRPSLLSPELEDFFDRERRILARMKHPNVARLFDGGLSVEGVPWFAMDLIEGLPLDEWASIVPPSGSPRRDVAARVRIAASICNAVHHAHRNLIVHADLKPPNILIDQDFEPRLVDFGIAGLVAAADDPALTRRYPNTPTYASPERLDGAAPSIPDDIFALGTVLHGLLSDAWIEKGERSLPPPSVAASDPARGRILRGDLDAIVARARSAEPSARYASAEDMAADLRAWLQRRPVAARGRNWQYSVRRFVRRHMLLTAAAGLALAALLGTGAIISTLYVRANSALAAAEQRHGEMHRLARYLIVDLDDELEPLAGTSELRSRSAGLALDHLRRLADLGDGDPDVRRDLAIGLGRDEDRDGPRHAQVLVQAEQLLAPLVEAHPNRRDLKVELAHILTARAVIAARRDPPGADALLSRAIALSDAALNGAPAYYDASYARWHAVQVQIDLLAGRGRRGEAARLVAALFVRTQGLPTPERYAAARPLMDAAVQRSWGVALLGLGRRADPVTHYREAIRVLDAAIAHTPADIRVKVRRIVYTGELSDVLEAEGRTREARQSASRAWADARILMVFENSPAVMAVADAAGRRQFDLLSRAGKRREACQVAADARRLRAGSAAWAARRCGAGRPIG